MTFAPPCIVVSAGPTLPLVRFVRVCVYVENKRQPSPNAAIRARGQGKWSEGKWSVCVYALMCVCVCVCCCVYGGGVIMF